MGRNVKRNGKEKMEIVLRVYDFIKSWLYYPTMKIYLRRLGIDYPKRRFEYSLWHCQSGKLSDIGYENLKPRLKNIHDDWDRVYDREPIEGNKNHGNVV